MKIVLLSATNSRASGGLFYSIKNLGLSLMHHCQQEVCYVCHDDKYSSEDRITYKDLPLATYHVSSLPLLNKWGYSKDLIKILEKQNPDIIDLQGTWMYYSYAALKYVSKHPKTKIVITPRGTLDRQQKNKLSLQKRISCWLYENKNFRQASCLRALNIQEYKSMLDFGIKCPIAIIPNGFTLPKEINKQTHNLKTLLFIGRIHPKKGLPELLKGISLLKKQNPELMSQWRVRIAGWDQKGHEMLLKKIISDHQLEEYVSLIGPKFGQEKSEELQQADAFVLTSFSEGMPMSVLEAWAYKLPVLMTDGCNLPDGFKYNAALRVDTTPESICKGLKVLFSMNMDELEEMGNNGYHLVEKKYQWDKIAEDSLHLYEWILGSKSKPSFVFE